MDEGEDTGIGMVQLLFNTTMKTAKLESKLQQALEAVSRMETLRTTFADAYKMNEQLQSNLKDLRTKTAKMVAETVAVREKNKEAESQTVTNNNFTSCFKSETASTRRATPLVRKYSLFLSGAGWLRLLFAR